MRIAFYFLALLLFIVSAGVLAFAPVTRENLDLTVSLAEAGISIIALNAIVDFSKYLLRMGEYSTTK